MCCNLPINVSILIWCEISPKCKKIKTNQDKLGLQPLQRFFGTSLKNQKYKVFGLGSPDLEHLLLEVTKQQQDYKFFIVLHVLSYWSCTKFG